MNRKRYRKGQKVNDFLVFHKEAYPHITNSGKRRRRMAFFECALHTDRFYLLSINDAIGTKRKGCLCDSEFNKERTYDTISKKNANAYSYQNKHNWHKTATKLCPPGWFWVSRIGIFLKKKDGSNLLFYKFSKTNRSGADYRTARRIEDITWNRPKENKAFYLMRMSYEMDVLHSEGVISFKSDLWNRGAGLEYFEEFLINNDIK